MTISTIDGLVNALANDSSRLVIDKISISSTTVGQFHSLWKANGQPGAGPTPTTIDIPTSSTLGGFSFTQQTAPRTSYLAYMEICGTVNAFTTEVHDRLAHQGGLVSNITTPQTTNLPLDLNTYLATNNLVARIGDDNYSDVQWWIEWYVNGGTTAATLTINVIYDDGLTGDLSPVPCLASRKASFMQPLNSYIPAAKSGSFIRGINSVTFSASTLTAGSLGITATRPRVSLSAPLANFKFSADWASLPLSEVPNESCLFLIQLAGSTTTGSVRGNCKVAHG